METDERGYYAALGVRPSASASEIKSAYRHLVKLHHPDSNASLDDTEIKRINEAYAVLSDPERRAAYDSESIDSEKVEATQQRTVEPLRCSRCQKITAQPRYLIFWRVYSLIFATGRTPIQGIFCASCAKVEALRSTTMTALLGWWGIPWGPIWTVASGYRDAIGGEQDDHRNEVLAWHNVVAFIQARQITIAYGLADRLTNAQDKKIREAAGDFTALCRSHGFKPTGELRDPWSQVRGQTPLRIAILASLPTLILGWIFLATSSGSSTAYSYPSNAAYSYSSPSSPATTPPNAPADSQAAEEVDLGPPCAATPANGKVLAGRSNLSSEGHRLEIDNGSSGDAIVKIRNASTNRVYASFFVRKAAKASLDGIEDGSYTIQYAVGDRLTEGCDSFTGDFRVAEFPATEPFHAEYVNDYRGEGYTYQVLSYTLYTVAGGNVRPTSISATDFNSN